MCSTRCSSLQQCAYRMELSAAHRVSRKTTVSGNVDDGASPDNGRSTWSGAVSVVAVVVVRFRKRRPAPRA